jgi:hypothetical protein
MKRSLIAFAGLAALIVVGAAAAQEKQPAEKPKKWVCSIPSGVQLISYHYTGGDWANIHIAPFNTGGSYRVKRDGDDKVVGTTANGTEFVCTLETTKS